MSAVKRGCGTREKGGAYLETRLSPHGLSVESFLVCPPSLIDKPAEAGITPIGQAFVERAGVTHVIDWVGTQHYPNVADFIEEVRRMGVSRRISKAADFKRLTLDSRLLLVHSRAYIHNYEAFYAALGDEQSSTCPIERADFRETMHRWVPGEMCGGLWYEDVAGGRPATDSSGDILDQVKHLLDGDDRLLIRDMPGFEYAARRRPDTFSPLYGVAVFASFPIGQITVIDDPETGSHEDVVDVARQSGLPVYVEDE